MKGQKPTKGLYDAQVTANRRIGECFYKLSIEFENDAAKVFADTKPGQFAELDLADTALPSEENIPEELRYAAGRKIILRRPFSFCDVSVRGNKTAVVILYCVVGPSTLRMTTLAGGDILSVIGPLGNGFHVPEGKKKAVLVAGGMGAAPLLHLVKILIENHPDIEITALVGAKTVKDFPFEANAEKTDGKTGLSIPELVKYKIKSIVTTDDGSAGEKGFVTDCLAKWLDKDEQPETIIIYGCGPETMLAKVAQIAKKKKIDCQISMERRMACGIGLCQSCAVECRSQETSENIYKMCCKDGPVFEAKEVVFDV
jgi:dihydroorotate dehydrogenase electron transfer subunit